MMKYKKAVVCAGMRHTAAFLISIKKGGPASFECRRVMKKKSI